MISIKSEKEIEYMRIAGSLVYKTHKFLKPYLKQGITTKKLDELAYNYIVANDATPSFKGYQGFPYSICTSINEEVVHGMPSNRKLKNGDIISIDIGVCYKGYHGDSAWTYKIGNVDPKKDYLMTHTQNALYEGIKVVKNGIRVSEISKAIQTYALEHKLGIVRELVGHGVGSNLHEDPEVPNFVSDNTDWILKTNMVIAIEPMLNLGTAAIYILDDDWTIVTRDKKPSAHFEHTVLVKEDGYEILTGSD